MNISGVNHGGPQALPEIPAVDHAPLPGAMPLDAAWMQELIASAVALQRKDGPDDGMVDANGAPALPGPVVDFSGDQLALILAALDGKIKDAQIRSAKEGIESARQRTEAANHRMTEQMQEVSAKLGEAADKQKVVKVLSWIAKIAAVVGAIAGIAAGVALLVATEGAAAPLAIPLIAIASVGLVAATVDLASQIHREFDPDAKAFTVGTLIADGIVAGMDHAHLQGAGRVAVSAAGIWLGLFLMQPDLAGQMAGEAGKAGGMKEADAAKLAMAVEIAAVLLTVAAMLALSAASLGSGSVSAAGSAVSAGAKAVDTGAKVVSTTARLAQTTARLAAVTQAVVSIIQGATGVGSGAVGMEVAALTRDADEARAATRRIEALLQQLQAQSEEQVQRLRDIIEALDAGMAQFSQMVAAAGDQRANQVKNLVRG